jgi:N-acetylgalactosamine kinase
VRVEDPNHVLAFNNPAELLEIEVYFQRKRLPREAGLPIGPGFRSVADWIAAMELLDAPDDIQEALLRRELHAIYGDHPDLLAERRLAYLALLDRAKEVLGAQAPVLLVRSPGRVNILGRHVDHQGGNCNLMAIDREIIMAAHPREDDEMHLYNVAEEPFGSRQFSMGEMLTHLPWDDWMSLVNSAQVRQMVSAADWSQYVQAAVLRLQKRFATKRLLGMDLVVYGNIPIAAGLSSSSALVVASAEATVAVNDLKVLPAQFVDLCGEGEWFVGTRGGSADHAAMKFGQKGKVAKVTFFEFGVEKMVDFPGDYRLVVCNSGIQARKASSSRDVFNHRIACYHLGLRMIRDRHPQYAPLIKHLRDVNTRNLGVPLGWIYRILLGLPERASREELNSLLPSKELEPILVSHAPAAEGYPIRGVVLFGLAECERSRVAVDLLAKGQVDEFGRLMKVSHNGDRVVCHDANGTPRPYRYQVSDAYLLGLMAALESGDPERVTSAQLKWQPGAYRCSTPEIDLMVDVALSVPGVAGAQLAGAGLGGCMMVLAHRDATAELSERMNAGYYEPKGLAPDVSVCTPIAGSGVLLSPRHTGMN